MSGNETEPVDLETDRSLKVRYCRSLNKNPLKHCGACFFLIVLTCIIALSANPVLYGDTDISDPFTSAKESSDAIDLARASNAEDEEEDEGNTTVTTFFMYFDTGGEEIFQPEHIKSMCEYEKVLFNFYPNAFAQCDVETSQDTCVSYFRAIGGGLGSIAARTYQSVDPFFNYEDCFDLDEAQVSAFAEDFYFSLRNNSFSRVVDGLLINDDESASVVRSFGYLSIPRERGDAALKSIAEDVMAELFLSCGVDESDPAVLSPYLESCTKDGLDIVLFNELVLEDALFDIITQDFLLVVFSLSFVFAWIVFYTGSFFIAGAFVIYIFSAAGTAMFIYKNIFQILLYSFFHILAVFLIIGIGADAGFVVFDAFKQAEHIYLLDEEASEEEKEKVRLKQLVYAYKRSSSTVLSTSMTTIMAFVFTALTPLVPISSFGIYSALCVWMIYIYSLSIFPQTYLVWSRIINKKFKCSMCSCCHRKSRRTESGAEEVMHEKGHLDDLVSPQNKFIERFYVPCIFSRKREVAIFMTILGILGCIGTAQLRQLSGQEQFLPENHMLQRFINDFNGVFVSGSGEENGAVSLRWGLSGVDRDFFSRYQGIISEYKDTVVFDSSFVLDAETLVSIAETCDRITELECDIDACGSSDTLIQPESLEYTHTCPAKDVIQAIETTGGNVALMTPEQIASVVASIIEVNPFFEANMGLDSNGRVSFVVAEFRLTSSSFLSSADTRPLEDLVEEFVSEEKAEGNDSYSSMDYASALFVNLSVADSLLASTIRGLLTTFAAVFVILLLATRNVVLAGLSCLSISFIITCVLGFVSEVLGWELGVAESIVSIMIVGLSVDYAVHLMDMYVFAGREEGLTKREDRFHFSALTIAPTVLAGGVTTFGASIFLLGTNLVFFFKMGILLGLTIIFSLLFSLFFLMSYSAWIGPEGTYGDVVHMYTKWRNGDVETKEREEEKKEEVKQV